MMEAASFPAKPFTKMVVGSRKVHPMVVRSMPPSCWRMKKTLFFQRAGCWNAELVFQKKGVKKFQFRCCDGGNDVSEDFEGSVVGMKKKLAVFVSGGGSNFRSIHEATAQGIINGEVAVLVTDKPGCGGAKYATDNAIPLLSFPKTKSSVDGVSPLELVSSLRNFKIDFVLLAGYLKLIPNVLVQAFPRSILNIHPSLLPAFGGKGFFGLKVHQAVIASGARYSGPTIHYVDDHYDTGRILAQRTVPVLANDTAEQLAKRILHEEHKLYVEVVAALCEERVIWREDGVPLIRSKDNPNEYS